MKTPESRLAEHKFSVNAITYVSHFDNTIQISEEEELTGGQIVNSIMNLKEQAIRSALIELDWTPPENRATWKDIFALIKGKLKSQ